MAPTSEECREVARRLRENAEKHGVTLDYLGSTQVNSWWLLLNSIGCDSNHQEVAFNLIADLIDPTCEVVRKQVYAGGPQMYKTLWCCSKCGFPLAESKYKGHRPFVEERFCPRCGSRVTRGGDGL